MTLKKINVYFVFFGLIFITLLISCEPKNLEGHILIQSPQMKPNQLIEYTVNIDQDIEIVSGLTSENSQVSGLLHFSFFRPEISDNITVIIGPGKFSITQGLTVEEYSLEEMFTDSSLETFKKDNTYQFNLPINQSGEIDLSTLSKIMENSTSETGSGTVQQLLVEIYQNQLSPQKTRRVQIGEKYSVGNDGNIQSLFANQQITWEVTESTPEYYTLRGSGTYNHPKLNNSITQYEGSFVIQQKVGIDHGFPLSSSTRSTMFGTLISNTMEEPLIVKIQNYIRMTSNF